MGAPLVRSVLALAAGIVVGSQRFVPFVDGPFLLVFTLAGAGTAVVLGRSGSRRPGPGPVLALMLAAGLALGAAARAGADRQCAAWLPADLPLILHGVVTEAVSDRWWFRVDRVSIGDATAVCQGVVAARIDEGIEGAGAPSPGARVAARGRWWRPPGQEGTLRPTGLFLVDGLAADTREPGRSARHWRSGPSRALAGLRAAGRRRVERVFGPEAPLAASLLLAQRDGLDREVRDRFARAGLSHILAISGLHVGLVAGIFLLLAGAFRLRKERAAAVAAAATVAYVLLLGAPHSAARAALQIVLVLGARAAQRPARTAALIGAAAVVLLARDPGALFQPGFQLSFAGVAGILAMRRPLLERMRLLTRWTAGGAGVGRWLADGLATSVAATVATAPIVAWHFGRVAPVGILANLVAIPLLGATVPALGLAVAAGSVWPPAGRFLAGAGVLLLDGLEATARVAAGVPWGTVAVPASSAVVLTVAAGAAHMVTRRVGRVRWAVRAMVWCGVAGAVVVASPVRPTVDHVELHVIDVGQGDAIAIRSPGGRWLLVDAGVAREDYDAGARLVVPYLARRGVQRLEALIVTHPDADHMGGAGAVIRALRPRWVSDPGFGAAKAAYLQLLENAADRGVAWVAARPGIELDLDGMKVEVLHPWGAVSSDDANDASVVLRVVYGEFQALLTGDAPASVERALVRRWGRRMEADVLKVGHHGSSTSTSPELLAATGARLALISAGRGNRYGHPHRMVLERLEAAGLTVVRTDRHGSIVVRGSRTGGYSIE